MNKIISKSDDCLGQWVNGTTLVWVIREGLSEEITYLMEILIKESTLGVFGARVIQ